MNDTPNIKLGFLSLEFIVGDSSYWMTTGLGRDGFYFTRLPLSAFKGQLLPQFVSRDTDYSEILFDSERGTVLKYSQQGPEEIITLDGVGSQLLSWNEMATFLIDAIPLADQEGMWHRHIVRPIDPSLNIADVRYEVTAFLPPPDSNSVFAVCGEDYAAGNPNWISFNVTNAEEFKSRLRQFKVEILAFKGKHYLAEPHHAPLS